MVPKEALPSSKRTIAARNTKELGGFMEKKREEKKDAGKKRREKGRRPLLEKLLWQPPRPPVWSLECSRYNLIEIHCY